MFLFPWAKLCHTILLVRGQPEDWYEADVLFEGCSPFSMNISVLLCSVLTLGVFSYRYPGATHIISNPEGLANPLIVNSMDPRLNPTMIFDAIRLMSTGEN
ncbi:MAG: uncharacterized protein A8A55_1120 [Amphiamblys sp. WSBS2006]|nr:MAG: uncharacterized protein A8A55_1120 [Amphiamblys sp. WSBS2006]